jgi:hypothetical protein
MLTGAQLIELPLDFAVALAVRRHSLPIKLKALVDQVVAIGLHFLLIDWSGNL